ncbi:alpha/beta hydrolase [Pedobacter boryungensis]|uniref:Alpha/beta hydrolase n=1 Tax=Pedobacter boryungensis TaxID=869962 RepID=A0ABX2DC85_9SPHI|nr:alpha/beta hydrolase [Pedobacter boryungensis]NQX31693.1 alpha/beta hydrolase [Pedobacter boryungensis]
MIYFISGLGADERVFQFLDLQNTDHKFIKWIAPQPAERLSDYCKKLIDQIDIKQEVILIGISFGGIVAQEISKLISCKTTIILSSIKSHKEFSWQLTFARKTQLHKIIPLWILQLSNKIAANYYFGVKSKEESKLLHQIIKDTDPKFLVWAIDKIMNWKNESYPKNLYHIHGTSDKIFPVNNIKNVIEIPNGGHFMIVNKASQLQQLIFDIIK